jgi:hypothetical protein
MKYLESEEEEEEEEEDETDGTESEEEPVIKHPKTRMVTRQMSLIMNHQIKTKVKVQPFVDHTEDTLRFEKNHQLIFSNIKFIFPVKMEKINLVLVFVLDV